MPDPIPVPFDPAAPDGERPRFVMAGVDRPLPDGRPGVMLLASVTLTHADLESELANFEDRYDVPWLAGTMAAEYRVGWRPKYRYTLTAGMDTFVMIHAATWAEAFAHLLQQWNPDRPDQPTRPGGMITSGGMLAKLADDECVLRPVRDEATGQTTGWHCIRDHDHGTQP